MARMCVFSFVGDRVEFGTRKREWTMDEITEAISRVNNHHLPFIINHFIVFASFACIDVSMSEWESDLKLFLCCGTNAVLRAAWPESTQPKFPTSV